MLIYIVMPYHRIGIAVVAKLLEAIGLWYSTVNFHQNKHQ